MPEGDIVEKMALFTWESTDGCHRHKAEQVLFPLAERTLSAADKAALAADFERIEREEAGEDMHAGDDVLAHELSKD